MRSSYVPNSVVSTLVMSPKDLNQALSILDTLLITGYAIRISECHVHHHPVRHNQGIDTRR